MQVPNDNPKMSPFTGTTDIGTEKKEKLSSTGTSTGVENRERVSLKQRIAKCIRAVKQFFGFGSERPSYISTSKSKFPTQLTTEEYKKLSPKAQSFEDALFSSTRQMVINREGKTVDKKEHETFEAIKTGVEELKEKIETDETIESLKTEVKALEEKEEAGEALSPQDQRKLQDFRQAIKDMHNHLGLSELESKIQSAEEKYGSNHPEIIAAKKELQELQK